MISSQTTRIRQPQTDNSTNRRDDVKNEVEKYFSTNNRKPMMDNEKKKAGLSFVISALIGALISWLLFDWKSPSGVIIIFCMALGRLVNLGATDDFKQKHVPAALRLRKTPPWDRIVPVSGSLFIFFLLGGLLLSSSKIFVNEQLRSAMLFISGGLGLLGGAPLMAALESKLRQTWLLCCSMGLALLTIGTSILVSPQGDRAYTLYLFTGSIVLPLLGMVFFQRGKKVP